MVLLIILGWLGSGLSFQEHVEVHMIRQSSVPTYLVKSYLLILYCKSRNREALIQLGGEELWQERQRSGSARIMVTHICEWTSVCRHVSSILVDSAEDRWIDPPNAPDRYVEVDRKTDRQIVG